MSKPFTIRLSAKRMRGVRYFSYMNPWVDFLVICQEDAVSHVARAVMKAMRNFWMEDPVDDDDGPNFECYGDSVEAELSSLHTPYMVIYHSSEDESEEYEAWWDEMISGIDWVSARICGGD